MRSFFCKSGLFGALLPICHTAKRRREVYATQCLIFGLSMTDYPNSGGRELRLPKGAPTETKAHVKQRQWLLAFLAIVVGVGALIGGSLAYWGHRRPQAPTEIFEGIAYGRKRLDTTSEGSGLLHWVRVNLAAPGIELYVTPLDPAAVAQGSQYRLRRIGHVVDREHLAVAINGALFASNSGWRPRMSGDLAKGVETVVADHVVSHVWEHTYLLWFDEQLTPHLRPSKPPTAAELNMAKWGIGGQAVWLWDGKVWPGSSRNPDSRTAVAVDRPRKLLFLAVGENISPHLMLQELADLGAKDGMLLDGGGSSSMAIGKEPAGISAGVLYGGWRPVATHFGIRARPAQLRK
jgi:Phosphodiester glycosidase